MFPKASLLLPICFQVIRTLSNSGSVVEEIHGGLKIGKAVSVRIQENDSEKMYSKFAFYECKLWLATESEIDKGDVGLHVSAQAFGTFHINTKSNGTWNNGDDYSILDNPKLVGFEVVVEEGFFDIRIFDEQIYRDFDIPIERLKYIQVECTSQVTFDFKWERKFVLCPSKP